MRYLHTMVRVHDIENSLAFYCGALGLRETRRIELESGRFTLVYLSCDDGQSELELTYNWDKSEKIDTGRSFGHLAYEVDDIYNYCQKLTELGIKLLRPPRDGRMAFIRSPDNISIELLQKGSSLKIKEPWSSMENEGEW